MMPQRTPDSLAFEFRDVDSAAPDEVLRCLDTLQTMEAGRAYKARALEHLGLGPACAALDVPCGLGDDVARMRARCARAVGVDRSRTLIAAARSRHAGAGLSPFSFLPCLPRLAPFYGGELSAPQTRGRS